MAAKFNNNVQEEKCLCKTHYYANVLNQQYGMENTVSLIHAQMEDSGVRNLNHVLALIIKFGIMIVVFHPKFLVPMEKFGIL